jgi:hypothetical protein
MFLFVCPRVHSSAHRHTQYPRAACVPRRRLCAVACITRWALLFVGVASSMMPTTPTTAAIAAIAGAADTSPLTIVV